MKKILFVLLFITSSLFAQDEIKRHPMWRDAGSGVMTPKAQYNLNPFGNQLGNLGATGTRWNFAYLDTTTTNHLNNTTWTLNSVAVTATGTQFNYLSGATGTTGTTSTNLVFSTSPVLVTPSLGVATGTSLVLGDGTDTYKMLVSSDKWTLQNDAGSPTSLMTVDSLASVIIEATSSPIPLLINGSTKGNYVLQMDASNGSTWGFEIDSGDNFGIRKAGVGKAAAFVVGGNNYINGNLGVSIDPALATLHINGTAMFGAGTGASLTDSSLVVNYSTGSPVLNWYGTDGDTWNIGINTSDAAVFTGASGGYSFDNNMLFADPGTSANSYSISLVADNATTPQTGKIQVMYGANPYMRFSPPNAAGTATAFIDLKSNQMIFPDSTSLTTNTGASDAMLFKAVDNDDGLLYEVARLNGGTTPTFDLFAGRLTGALSGNSQNITGIGQLAATTYGSDGSVSNAELLFINTLSSNAQTQIDAKAPSTSPTFATSITGSYLTASEMLITDGSKNIVSAPVVTYPSLTELTYVKGVTSAIQTQFNLKAPLASPTFTGTVTIPTPFTLGAISVTATGTELNYVAGVTSSIQTQLNSKAPTANPTFTGTVRRSVTATITASTTQTQGQGALTTDVNEVSVVANVNDVVTLPAAIADVSLEITIFNNGANTLQIFPASGDNLGAGLNASTTLASGSNVTFASYNDTNWEIK